MTTNIFKPILFSTEMVQAILAGRKTQTRRVLVDWDQHKPKFIISGQGMYAGKYPEPSKYMAHFRYPTESTDSCGLVAPIQPGDILWVRETFQKLESVIHKEVDFLYKADVEYHNYFNSDLVVWTPSIHMPKEAARIFLKVTKVRCERLHDISEGDAIAEGIKSHIFPESGKPCYYFYPCNDLRDDSYLDFPQTSFYSLWQSINAKKYPWDSNPWVWVYDFERIEKPENFK